MSPTILKNGWLIISVSTDEERCAEFRKLERIDDAFRTGDLSALRAAVDDPSVIPNGRMADTIGSCLVYAIYRSPLEFIRTLLEIGADPNAPADDGFPPLIAALSCTRDAAGAVRRTDVDDIIRVLLSFGADPNQRGINDYTAWFAGDREMAAPLRGSVRPHTRQPRSCRPPTALRQRVS